MKKVYIAGHKGLVGSAIERVFTNKGYKDIIKKTHSELDLRERDKVFEFFKKEKPEWVILSAAKVGGQVWSAVCEKQDMEIKAGSLVVIHAVEGVKLIVVPIEEH